MRLGYACMNTELKTIFRTARLATIAAEGSGKIKQLALENMKTTLSVIEWNIEHGIYFYRASSSIIPLVTHPVNDWIYWEDSDFLDIAGKIRSLVKKHGMRVSVHPGQYTVLNSPKPEVVEKSIADLEYHDRLIRLLGGRDIIVHTGGAYGDKERAKERFAANYLQLSQSLREGIRLENDDKTFNIRDVLDVHKLCGVPVCFDIHHHRCNPSGEAVDITEILATWEGFGVPKIHISSGKEFPTDLRHHAYIFEDDFNELLELLAGEDADIMFEAKMKEQSVLPFLDKLKERSS